MPLWCLPGTVGILRTRSWQLHRTISKMYQYRRSETGLSSGFDQVDTQYNWKKKRYMQRRSLISYCSTEYGVENLEDGNVDIACTCGEYIYTEYCKANAEVRPARTEW